MHVHLLLSLSARRGQPVVLDMMTKQFGKDFDERFGHKTGRTLLSATAGSLIGIGEIIRIIQQSRVQTGSGISLVYNR